MQNILFQKWQILSCKNYLLKNILNETKYMSSPSFTQFVTMLFTTILIMLMKTPHKDSLKNPGLVFLALSWEDRTITSVQLKNRLKRCILKELKCCIFIYIFTIMTNRLQASLIVTGYVELSTLSTVSNTLAKTVSTVPWTFLSRISIS